MTFWLHWCGSSWPFAPLRVQQGRQGVEAGPWPVGHTKGLPLELPRVNPRSLSWSQVQNRGFLLGPGPKLESYLGPRPKGKGTRDQRPGTRDQRPGRRGQGQGTRDQGQGTGDKGPGTRARDKGPWARARAKAGPSRAKPGPSQGPSQGQSLGGTLKYFFSKMENKNRHK